MSSKATEVDVDAKKDEVSVADTDKEEEELPVCMIMAVGQRNDALSDKQIIQSKLFCDETVTFAADQRQSPVWQIRTKYYTARVSLDVLALPLPPEHERSRLSAAEACVVFVSAQTGLSGHWDALETLQQRLPADCDSRLFVVEAFRDDEDAEQEQERVRQWCLEKGFELIDYSEDSSDSGSDNDDEDASNLIFATSGQKRVIEALHTCPWSNMARSVASGTRGACPPPPSSTEGRSSAVAVNGEGESGDEEFEQLFAKLAAMKERSTQLPENSSERKAYAEMVVRSFWSALGGDEDELEGLEQEDSD